MALPKIGDGEQLGDGNIGETLYLGKSSLQPVAFFGATGSTQPSSASQAAAISTAPVSISATQWGFTSSAQALSIITLLNQIRTDLVSLGIIKGS